MGAIRDLAEGCWAGAVPARRFWAPTGGTEELVPDVVFLHTFANMSVIRTRVGLVLVDTSNYAAQDRTFDLVRSVDPAPVHTVIYTHGHADHACGMPPFLAEAAARGWARPRIVGHRNVAARFDRYTRTADFNGLINARQFGIPPTWPRDYQYPDTVYDDTLRLEAGETVLELRHARGETDDHTWVWWPDRGVLWSGDQFIWVAPNAGNPQKVQRYAAEWAASLHAMSVCDAEVLIPGHGPPILGRLRVRQALTETAEWLEYLVGETLRRMNAGATLDEILDEVRPPERLAARPYLQAVYDEPEYVVRNIWRLYGGWWDGIAANLKPARHGALGREVAALAGGSGALAARAQQLAEAGDLALAGHLVDWAVAAAPDDPEVHRVRATVYDARARSAEALMTRGIFTAEAQASARRAEP